MLIVHRPEIENLSNGNVRLKVVFEVDNEKKEMWYSTSAEYGKYLCHERGDAFIFPLLIYAMKRNLAIKLEAPISERLYYTITNYLMKTMVFIFKEWHEVTLDCPTSSERLQNTGAVGTGLSCGIDSFSTVIDHLSERQPKGYRLTHATFFNVGGHSPLWTDPEKTQDLFQRRADRARKCAEELGLPFVVIDSNMEEILEKPFTSTFTFANVSAVLALQKLFKIYYCSSADRFEGFHLSREYSCDYDLFNLPMVSTETLIFFSSMAQYTRVEKTDLVTTFPVSYRFLDVCVHEDRNCGKCEKCLRTLLTLDVLGKLHLYKNLFDIRLYQKMRASFIGYILMKRHKNLYYKEIYEKMSATGYKLGPHIVYYLHWFIYRIKNKINRIFRIEQASI